jgi:hypothetical protein
MLDQAIQPFVYLPEGRRDLIVQGSSPIKAHGREWRLPVYPPTKVFTLASPLPPWDAPEIPFCVVRRDRQAVTCHVCEGGHHAHIKWGEM